MWPPKWRAPNCGSASAPPASMSLACAATSVRPGRAASHPGGSRKVGGSLNGVGLWPAVKNV